jgi:hypothetical protein
MSCSRIDWIRELVSTVESLDQEARDAVMRVVYKFTKISGGRENSYPSVPGEVGKVVYWFGLVSLLDGVIRYKSWPGDVVCPLEN